MNLQAYKPTNLQTYQVLFIGTPDFSIPSLQALIESPDFNVVGVVTQPDKPVGRKQTLTPTAVKTKALKHNIKVYQPTSIKDFELNIKNLDLIVVVAYSQLIPKRILDLPRYGCINVHGSLLPRCRGAACIQKPIMDGDPKTGVTIMLMDVGLDTGPILCQKEIKIEDNDTTGSMFDKVALTGAQLLASTLKDYIEGKIKPQAQIGPADYIGQIKKKDGHLDFSKNAIEIERFIRAMTPWPGAYGFADINGQKKMLKIISVKHEPIEKNGHPGELICLENNLLLQCKDNALKVLEIQMEGKKKISSNEFICGSKSTLHLY